MKRLAAARILFALFALPLAPMLHAQPGAATAPPAATLADGEVHKVDRTAGTVTIKHGEISNLGMAPMTMVFTASAPKLLEGLKPGDRVKFAATMAGGKLTVTRIAPIR